MLTPEWLSTQAHTVEKLRLDILLNDDDNGTVEGSDDPEAAEYYLIAISLLDQAHRNLRLATLKQRQMVAHAQGGPR